MNTQFSLANIKFGDMLAKGCNAAVYSAQYQNPKSGNYISFFTTFIF